jgi:hypothetical protein
MIHARGLLNSVFNNLSFFPMYLTSSALTLNSSPSPRDPQLGVAGRGTLKGFLPFSQFWEKGLGDEGKPTDYQRDRSSPFHVWGDAQLMNICPLLAILN